MSVGRVRQVAVPAAVVLGFGALATLEGVLLTGAARPLVLGDPGALVRWGLPLFRFVNDLAAALTIGMLVLAAVALPVRQATARPGRKADIAPRAYPQALLIAALASALWAVSTVALSVLSYADAAGVPLDDAGFGQQLVAFLTRIDLGRGLLVTAVVAVLVAMLAAGATTLRAAGLLALVSLIGLVPPALGGHASGATDHETSVTALGLHLLGVCVWVGGLLSLALLWPALSAARNEAVVAAQRFSTLAGWCFGLVAGSGVINAVLRIGDIGGLATRYGVLVLLKATALGVLGAVGWRHRRATLPALAEGRPRAFTRLIGVEAAVMAVAVGMSAALSRSAPPVAAVPPADPSLAQLLTGYPMPPPPTALRWLTSWQPDLLWLTIAILAAGLYLAGVTRLGGRGDRWPVARTVTWLSGLAVLTWTTSGGPAVYGRVLFSGHMLGHMTVSMVVPSLLVLGAPATLALRTLPSRHDGTRGPREWLLAVLESWPLRVLGNPIVAAVLFTGSLVAFYYTGLFELALTTHVGHELMHLHFLLAGYLFMWVLMGIDPGPSRLAPPLKLVLLLATMAFHAFFGVALLVGRTVLAGEYFGALGRTWGAGPLVDQQSGGGLAWGFGDVPTLLVALVIAVQWARSDEREARRFDRAADRDGDAELVAYNEMLARIAARDRTGGKSGA